MQESKSSAPGISQRFYWISMEISILLRLVSLMNLILYFILLDRYSRNRTLLRDFINELNSWLVFRHL